MNTKPNKFEVARIGFENENPTCDIVLLSRKERANLDVEVASPVKVKKGRKVQIAVVQIQFKDLLNQESICTMNTKLSESLGVKVGDKVTISKEVTETEWNDYNRSMPSPFSFSLG